MSSLIKVDKYGYRLPTQISTEAKIIYCQYENIIRKRFPKKRTKMELFRDEDHAAKRRPIAGRCASAPSAEFRLSQIFSVAIGTGWYWRSLPSGRSNLHAERLTESSEQLL
jgi:hypothetical protein